MEPRACTHCKEPEDAHYDLDADNGVTLFDICPGQLEDIDTFEPDEDDGLSGND